MNVLAQLAPLGLYVLAVMAVIAMIILVAMRFKSRAGRSRQLLSNSRETPGDTAEDAGQDAPSVAIRPSPSPRHLKASFATAAKRLRRHTTGNSIRYRIPWFLMLGEAASGKTTLLRHTELSQPLSEPDDGEPSGQQDCGWCFFEQGIVLDVAGDYVLRADGSASEGKGWQTLLKLLRSYRPERPIDGVILTIPCTDLMGPERLHAARLSDAETKAARLYRKLWEMQKSLGFCFPVYILVTKCDEIPGFQSFSQALPAQRHHEMFGWANPYGLEKAYDSHWADEACQQMYAELLQSQAEIFAEGEPVQDSDAFFAFPAAFQAMFAPLRSYLDRLFKPSVYHEAPFFRGLYFCGASQPEAFAVNDRTASAGAAPAHIVSDGGKVLFLRDLFARKIFPEHGLARPASKAFFSRNRSVLIAQALLFAVTLVGGIGLWSAYDRLAQSKHTLLPVLETVVADLKDVQGRKTVEGVMFDKQTRHLVQGMTAISTTSLQSVFIPASWPWFATVHQDLIDAMTLATRKILMTSMLTQLSHKASQIVNQQPVVKSDTGTRRGLSPAETPAFVTLRRYIEDLTELEKNIRRYNQLQMPGNSEPNALGKVVKYVFDIEVPSDFYSNEYSQGALANVSGPKINPQDFQPIAKDQTRERGRRVNDTLFNSNALLTQLQTIPRTLDNLDRIHQTTSGVLVFRELLETITQTEQFLAQPEFAWLSKDRMDLGPEFDQLFTAISESVFLGPPLRQEIERSWQAAFTTLKAELSALESERVGRLLHHEDGGTRLELSEAVLRLKQTLKTFLNLEFVRHEAKAGERAELGPNVRLFWETRLLEEAIGLHKPYNRFVTETLADVPLWLGNRLKAAASQQLEANARNLIAQAQHVMPRSDRFVGTRRLEEGIRPEIQNFTEVAPSLSRLVNTLRQLELFDAATEVSNLAARQADNLLNTVDQLLEQEALYQIQDGSFAWWHGDAPPAFAAFAVENDKEFTYYLELQRDRIAHLARAYAEPVVAVLKGGSLWSRRGQKRLLVKWEGILAELDKYENKKPGNAVSALEKFIQFDMTQVTMQNCLETMTPNKFANPGGDFFLQQRHRLSQALYRQCQALATDRVIEEYHRIAHAFSRELAGKFPFATGGIDEEDLGVGPQAIRDFYRVFDTYAPSARELLHETSHLALDRKQALAFLDQMAAVRVFLAAFVDADASQQSPAFDIAVDFRVNRKHERDGHHIIDWRLDVGDQTVRHHNAQRLGRWSFDDPIVLTLRWAKNAPRLPSAKANPPEVEINESTVVYRYTDSWSLIRFLRQHRGAPGDFSRFVDPKPHTLKFLIGTAPPVREGQPEDVKADASHAKVFLRIRLMSPDKKDPLKLPFFPVQAPLLHPEASRNALSSKFSY